MTASRPHAVLLPQLGRGGSECGALLIFPATPSNRLPTSRCEQGEEHSRPHALLPPLHRRGGPGWGALLIFPATPSNPLPTSPCIQGEEHSETSA
jgi:hypothetical protein